MMRVLALAFLMVALLGADARAGVPRIETEHVAAELVLRNRLTKPGDTVEVAIRTRLKEGWHTYWINPGDSGDAPIIDMDLPDGGSMGEVRFPTPSRLPYPPLLNFGYSDEFTLLTSVTIPADWQAGTRYEIPVRIDWLVCADICIPEGGATRLVIPTGVESEQNSAVAFSFMQADWALPQESDAAATYSRDDTMLFLTVPIGKAEDAVFFPLQRGVIDNAAEQRATPAAEGEGMTLALMAGNAVLDGTMRGILKTTDGAWWITATGDPDPVAPVATAAAEPGGSAPTVAGGGDGPVRTAALPAMAEAPGAQIGALEAMLFAFLGGLILNLMPCVFPVLALKVLGLVAHADAPFGRRAVVGAAYASGILTTFAVLAAVLIGLKSAGVAVGWGFQLQSPVFVAVMAAALFAVGLNLSGVFEIGAGLTRLGGRGPQDGVGGAFATGCLATVVATPCTAPFMAVAIGTALAASELTALGVFFALGLGLATPFVLLTLVPGLARVLPRPGGWMARLKEALAFPLYATVAWLVWVLAQLVGIEAMLGALVALVLVGLGAWLYGLSQRGGGRSHRAASVLAVLSLIAAVFLAWPSVTGAPPVAVARASDSEPFSPERLAALESSRQPVFLNVTAAWCITCKVNERVVFDGADFRDLLAERGVTFMTADWTRRDPDVTALIDRFGRAGVPLYVYFPPEGTPKVLPQILTLASLEDAFQTR